VKSGEEARTALLDLHTDQRGRFMASRGLLSGDNFSLADFSRRQVGSGGLVIFGWWRAQTHTGRVTAFSDLCASALVKKI